MVFYMINGKVGLGIIGCGVIANYHSSAIFQLSKKAKLIGVTDGKPDRAKKFAAEHKTAFFSNLEEMLASPEVDVVCICTPSGLHAEAAIACAKAGKHVIIEKPLGITTKQLDEVEQIIEETGIKASCILQSRFYSSIKRAKSALDEGLLGKMVCADVYMKYNRTQAYYDSSAWRGTKALDGGGALINQGIHGIDLLLYFMGPVKSVFAFSKTLRHNIEVEDTLVCALEFVNGALGVVEATTSITPGYPRLLNLHGEKGTISLEENSIVRWDIEKTANEEDLVITPSGFTAAQTPTAISSDGHLFQIEDMIDSVLENRKPFVGIKEGRESIDLILAIYRSAEEKRLINLSE